MAKNVGMIELVLAELHQLRGQAARTVEVNGAAARRGRAEVATVQSITQDVREHQFTAQDRAVVATMVSPLISNWQNTKDAAAAADTLYAACSTAIGLVATELDSASADE